VVEKKKTAFLTFLAFTWQGDLVTLKI